MKYHLYIKNASSRYICSCFQKHPVGRGCGRHFSWIQPQGTCWWNCLFFPVCQRHPQNVLSLLCSSLPSHPGERPSKIHVSGLQAEMAPCPAPLGRQQSLAAGDNGRQGTFSGKAVANWHKLCLLCAGVTQPNSSRHLSLPKRSVALIPDLPTVSQLLFVLVWLTCLKFNRTGTLLPSNGGLFPYFRLLVYYLCSWRSLTGNTCNLGCQTDLVWSAGSEHTPLLSSNGRQTYIQCKPQTSGGPYAN